MHGFILRRRREAESFPQVEKYFALTATPSSIRYQGDDGEVTDVTSDGELSLSDTTSLVSLEEYEDPNASDLTPAWEPLNGSEEAFDLENCNSELLGDDPSWHTGSLDRI